MSLFLLSPTTLFYLYVIIALLSAVPALHCCEGFSLGVGSRGYSLVAEFGGGVSCCGAQALLPAASGAATPGLLGTGSAAAASGPSCAAACGTFPEQGSNPPLCMGRQVLYHWAPREASPTTFKRHYVFPRAVEGASPCLCSVSPWSAQTDQRTHRHAQPRTGTHRHAQRPRSLGRHFLTPPGRVSRSALWAPTAFCSRS